MPTELIIMPRMSDTMEDGTILLWLKRVGDPVAIGEPLVEIDTDKAAITLDAEHDGVLSKILVAEGQTADVGSEIGMLAWGEDALRVTSLPEPGDDSDDGSLVLSVQQRAASSIDGGEKDAKSGPMSECSSANTYSGTSSVKSLASSPAARRLAKKYRLDIARLYPGRGPQGRVIKADIEHALLAANETSETSKVELCDELVTPSRIELVVAKKMTEAKNQIPHFYLSMRASMDPLMAMRKELNKLPTLGKVSITDMAVKACALALTQHSEVNASWTTEGILRRQSVNVGVAVGLDDGTLVVPVIHDAGKLPLREIAAESARKIQAAKDGKLCLEDMQGGTFTVSNLGMYGVCEFKAIINPPESAILALGSIMKMPVVMNDVVTTESQVTLSLSADHRLISGMMGAQFLRCIKDHLEKPDSLLA